MLHPHVYIAQSHAFRLRTLHMSSLQLSDDDDSEAHLGHTATIPPSNCQILNRKHFLSSTTSILLPPKSTVSMLRVISRSAAPRASIIRAVQLRGMADQRIENAAEAAGKAKDSSPKVIISSHLTLIFPVSHLPRTRNSWLTILCDRIHPSSRQQAP